ncbi:alpha/beta hydrolase [Pandoraea norimbergensis]|uniref:Alpha/beta hydrolase n=1 Tax=Pandoraea norimbergensis TaxID=93219 RepID=A0ABM5WN38_9BURK|nr:alpha/beta hydrolase [Pandoraea norimbergensis]ALS61401.1 alpha/beta hydrolase [Pandoraea norimbergensis]
MSANAKPQSGHASQTGDGLRIEDVSIAGHVGPLTLRLYRPVAKPGQSAKAAKAGQAGHPAQTGEPGVVVPLEASLPTVLYFHGGGFCTGTLDDGDAAARYLATHVPALVVSVAYSLAPEFPFPAAPEDAWCAALWVQRHARRYGASPRRLAVAGHDSGGNIATSLTMIARDRGEITISAQALLAPLLDPSMTRLANARTPSDIEASECAKCYRAYLPHATQRLHPYAAPLESRRLGGLPPTLIASAEHDLLHVEAEKYAAELIAAGVPTQVTRHRSASHHGLAALPAALREVAAFLTRRLAPPAAGSTQ